MNMRDIDLNLLVIFDAVYSTGNISRAAAQLDMSQPAMSNALRRLREQLDDPLFVRKGNGVEPTPRANELAGPIGDTITALKSALTPSDGFDPQASTRVFRLLIADPLEPILLPPVLREIEKTGGVTIELVPPQAGQVEHLLTEDAIDLAVFLPTQQSKSLMIEPLGTLDVVLIARQDHPRAGHVPFPELVARGGFAALNLSPAKLKNSEKVTIQTRFRKRDVIIVPRVSAIPQLVAQTDLLAFVPRLYATEVAKHYGVQIIDPPAPVGAQSVHMIWHRRNAEDMGIRWLRGAVSHAFPGAEAE